MVERNITILVRDKQAQVVGSPVIICGNSDYTITFDFDDDWSLTGVRSARFVYVKAGRVEHEDVAFPGDTVAVPVLSDVAFVNVGVFAGDLCTTTPARINCKQSILCGSGEKHEPTPDVYLQIMALFNELAEQGAFGATEEQAQQIAANTADIADLKSGDTPAGDANKLGGHSSEHFATAASVGAIIDGTTPAGDANKLGGKAASEYLTGTHTQPASSITGGTFAEEVAAAVPTADATACVRNAAILSTRPTVGETTSYADGTILFVKKQG